MNTRIFIAAFILMAPGFTARAGDVSAAELENLNTVQCGNLVYAKTQTSVCFADRFLTTAAAETTIRTTKKFAPVPLDSEALFKYPFCVFSGSGTFSLTEAERANLRRYLACGGFLLVSPGCSDAEWDKAFRKELELCLPDTPLKQIPMTHPIFSTVFKVPRLTLKGGGTTLLEGLEVNGRVALIYSREGLNDVAHAKGCCCCGGDQINECEMVNVNILAYALLY